MIKKIAGVFIVLSPFTSYFAISAWLRLPVVLMLILSALFVLKIITGKKINLKALSIDKEDILLVALLALIWLSWLLGFRESRSLNHALAYSFTILFYFFLFRSITRNEKIRSSEILQSFALSSSICCFIIILDWILINFFSLGIRDYFVNLDNKSANMLYFQRAIFLSVGGVAEEPGSMALLLNIIAPMGLLYHTLSNNWKQVFWLSAAYVLSLICLFSTAGIINLAVAIAFMSFHTFLTSSRIMVKLKTIYTVSAGVVLMMVVAILNQGLIVFLLREIRQKIFLSSEDASASIRAETWDKALNDWAQHPILGNGPGFGVDSYGTGYHSVYLTLLADTGMVALVFFILFLLSYFLRLLQLPKQQRFFVGVSLIATTIHFAIVGDFYHAPFWVLLILIGKLTFENKTLHTKNEVIDHYPNL